VCSTGTSQAETLLNRAEIILSFSPLDDPRLQAFGFQHMAQAAGLRQTAFVPLTAAGRRLGYLQVGDKRDGSTFDQDDLRLLSVIAGQVSPMIENASLVKASRRRAQRAETHRRIASLTSSTATLEEVLKFSLLDLARLLQADVALIYLIDGDRAELKIHRSSLFGIPPEIASQFENISVNDPRFPMTAAGSRKPLTSADLNADELEVPLHRLLIEKMKIRSIIDIPLIMHQRGIGEILIGSGRTGIFEPGDIQSVATAAGQLAAAIEQSMVSTTQAERPVGSIQRQQAQLEFHELLNQRTETLSRLDDISRSLSADLPLENAMSEIASAICSSTPFDKVWIGLYDSTSSQFALSASVGIPKTRLVELKAKPLSWDVIQSLIKPELQIGNAYLIPNGRSPDLLAGLGLIEQDPIAKPKNPNDWEPGGILILPLYDPSKQPLGVICAAAPRNHLNPDRLTIETLEVFGSQATLAFEKHLRIQELQDRLVAAQTSLGQTNDDLKRLQSSLAIAEELGREKSQEIDQLSERARQTLNGLDLTEKLNRQTTRESLYSTLGEGIHKQFGYDAVMVFEHRQGGFKLVHIQGTLPAGVNPEALLGQRNPVVSCLQDPEVLVIGDLSDSPDWQDSPLLYSIEAKGFACLPILTTPSPANTVSGKVSFPESDGNPEAVIVLAVCRSPLNPSIQDNVQLYQRIASQVGLTFQNIAKQEETTRRLREVDRLLEFSQKLGSLDPASILQALVDTALKIVPASQSAMVVMWDGTKETLSPQIAAGYVDNAKLLQMAYHPGEGLPGQVFSRKQAARLDEIDFPSHFNLSPENMKRYQSATGERLPVSCLIVPIGGGGSSPAKPALNPSDGSGEAYGVPLGVLVLENFQTGSAFTDDDLLMIQSLTQQTALALENARLYQATQQRSTQLSVLADAATRVTGSLRSDELVASLLEHLHHILQFDTGILWLRQRERNPHRGTEGRDRLVVRAAQGFTDVEHRIGLVVDTLDSQIMKEMIQTGKPVCVPNVLEDQRFMAANAFLESPEMEAETFPGYERLSWLGVPLIASGEVIGVIALEKAEANFYTPEDVQIVATFAGQAAAGLENAKLYRESLERAVVLDRQSTTLSRLNSLSSELSKSLDANQILNNSIIEFARIIPSTAVSFLLFESNTDIDEKAGEPLTHTILKAEHADFNLDPLSPALLGSSLPRVDLFERLRSTQSIFSSGDIDQESELGPLAGFLGRYHTRSLLIVPITGSGSTYMLDGSDHALQGMLLAHHDQPQHYHAEEIELARSIGNQIGIALQNAFLFEQTQSLTEDLELKVQQRTSELTLAQVRVETLLRIISELSASLDLDQVLHSTLEVLNEYVNADQITILIVRPGEQVLQRLASYGPLPEPVQDGSPTPLRTDQGLAGWIIAKRQPVLINDVQDDQRWQQLTYPETESETAFEHHSAMGVPLITGAEALGCLLLFHHEIAHFTDDHLELVHAAANQVSVAVNNAELYRLIRDQAEDLGTLLRSQQVETSRSKAILESVADGVLVTDAKRQITLFNASAERILGLKREMVLGKSLEQFSGLFGRASQSWMETIASWSVDLTPSQSGGTYEERIILEDGRVIAVRLTPVSLKTDFLGTVSIFQDITHQVEVDRLKSDFVATVSHELRTPMTSIKGYVEILLMGAAGRLTTKQRHFLDIVKSNTDRLSVLVNDLLDVSRIESGLVNLKLQPLVLQEIVDGSLAEIIRRAQLEGKPIQLVKDIQADLPRVLGDAERIRQILDNLLDNAYLYNSPGGSIILRLHQVDGEVQVDIQDSGVGINPDEIPHVFERFYRGENPLVMGVSGTGLGLSIVKYLIEMHQGRIWATSPGVPGAGSTFSFTLPVYRPQVK
jgi:PAS domain S-box-containing protein